MTAITIDGSELHFDDVKQISETEGGPAIVWAHGFLLQASFYRPIIDLLPDHRHVVMDLRGHGRSVGVTQDVTLSRMADDLWDLMEALGISDFIVVGHSMGNAVGMRVASRHPHAVVAGVSLAGVPPTGLPDQTRDGTHAMSCMAGDLEALTGALGGMFLHPGMTQVIASVGESARMVDAGVLVGIATIELYEDGSSAILPNLTQPWLFIVPGDDEPCPTESQVATGRAVRGSRTVILNGEGHMFPQERPVETAAWIRGFIGTLRDSRT